MNELKPDNKSKYPGENSLTSSDYARMWWYAVADLAGKVSVQVLNFFMRRAIKHTDESIKNRL